MGVDKMGVDKIGVDKMGVDKIGVDKMERHTMVVVICKLVNNC